MRLVHPPPLALRLLTWRLPEPDREYLVGDLLESFHALCAREGVARARAWFWRETIHLVLSPWPGPEPVDQHPREASMSFLNSLHVALRSLGRAPALATLVIVTLALGVGAATSVYSVARAALFDAPPFPDSDRLALVWEREKDGNETNLGFATIQDVIREGGVFQSAAAMSYWTPLISNSSETTRLAGQRVSWQFFDVLGVKPMLGRTFRPEEDRRGANAVVMMSHGLWSSRFGSDSAIVGREILVNGIAYSVAGVLPPSFESLLAPGTQIWAPLGYETSLSWACRTCRHLRLLARLRPDVSMDVAGSRLVDAYNRLKESFPQEYAGVGMSLTPLHEYVVRGTRPAFIALLAAVGVVALIACFNAANLLLGRALRRENEFALRVALGASAGRLSMMLLAEGLVIALAAAALGGVLAVAGVDVVLRLAPAGVPRLDRVQVDGGVLAFAAGLAMVTGLLASIVPAWALLRGGISDGMRGGARSVIGSGRHRLRGALVAAEVALAVVLVSSTSVLLASVSRLLAVDGGFATTNRLSMELNLSGPRYADSGSVAAAWRAVLDAAQAVPGTRSAALASMIPLGGNFDMYGLHQGGTNPAEDPSALRYAVSPGYLGTMAIPVLAGRGFNSGDVAGAPIVALLNEAASRRLAPDGNALGIRFTIGGLREPATVVGIVGNTVHTGLDAAPDLQVYIPADQWGEEGGMVLVVHTSGRPESMIPQVRSALQNAVPGIAISRTASLELLIGRSTADRRFALVLFAGFAIVALILATAGLYGVLSATVVERTREIGVRTALGAPRGRILSMVVRQGLTLTAIGLAVGLVATWGTSRVISALLYGVRAFDPSVLVVVISTLGAAALLASALPAWRALRVDPMVALRDS